MNIKLQEGIDYFSRIFTKRMGEIAVYAGAQALAYIIALLPALLTGGMMLFGIGNLAVNNISDLEAGLGSIMSSMMLTYAMMALSGLIIVIVVAPFLVSAAMTIITTTLENLSENVSLMIKNGLSKWGRILGTIGLILLVFIVVGIVVGIVFAILGFIFRLIPFIGLIILMILMIAVYIAIAYFAVPLYFAIFDAFLTDKPLVANITNALTKADKFRLPLLLTIIGFGIVLSIVIGILSAILGFIPFIGWILSLLVVLFVSGIGTVALLCLIYPYYKEYSAAQA